MTEAAGRKVNPKHPSDLEPEQASCEATRQLAPTVKVKEVALDRGDECRRILMLDGGEKGEDMMTQEQIKQEPQDMKNKVKRKVFWVRQPDAQLNASKFDSPKKFTDEDDGVMNVHQIHASFELGLGVVAFRSIPCHCPACRRQINLPWVDSLDHFSKQPRFDIVPKCRHRCVLSDKNKWHFAKLKQRTSKETDHHEFMDDDANLLREDIRNMIGERMVLTIEEGNFAGVVCADEEEEHGCCVVEWTGAPWINQDTRELMCEAVYWNKVPKTKHWCTRNDPPEKETFVLNHVLLGDLPLCKIDEDNEVPKGLAVSTKKSMIKKSKKSVG